MSIVVRNHAGCHGLALRLACEQVPKVHEDANGLVALVFGARYRRYRSDMTLRQRGEAQTEEDLGIGSEAGIDERGLGGGAVRSDDGALLFVLHEDFVVRCIITVRLVALIGVDTTRPVCRGEGSQADIRQADFDWVLKVTAGTSTARQDGGHLDLELLVARRSNVLRLRAGLAFCQLK
eukprot:scaffold63414_cov45-Phaeocystis_antarctica.AAC.1